MSSAVLVETRETGVKMTTLLAQIAHSKQKLINKIKQRNKLKRLNNPSISPNSSPNSSPSSPVGGGSDESEDEEVSIQELVQELYVNERYPIWLDEDILKQIPEVGIKAFFSMVFTGHAVHADLHPGNILVRFPRYHKLHHTNNTNIPENHENSKVAGSDVVILKDNGLTSAYDSENELDLLKRSKDNGDNTGEKDDADGGGVKTKTEYVYDAKLPEVELVFLDAGLVTHLDVRSLGLLGLLGLSRLCGSLIG